MWWRCKSVLLYPCRSTSNRIFRFVIFFATSLLLLMWTLHVTKEQVTYVLQEEEYNRTLQFRTPDASIYKWDIFSHRQCVNRTIAMGTAVTFRYQRSSLLYSNVIHLKDSPYFTDLLTTFCLTASENYCYTFYVAYDYNDPVLSLPQGRFTFLNSFRDVTDKTHCQKRININVKFVNCNYTGRPARSQNDAMMAGYEDKMEYYFMVNDDTYFNTRNWAEPLTKALQAMTPPYVGTTGPTQKGGNSRIMTYNFAHRTHIDIFGYFYPPEIITWNGDSWIDGLYRPHNSYKHPGVHVIHVQERGMRYGGSYFQKTLFKEIMTRSRKHLSAFVKAKYPGVNWVHGDVNIDKLFWTNRCFSDQVWIEINVAKIKNLEFGFQITIASANNVIQGLKLLINFRKVQCKFVCIHLNDWYTPILYILHTTYFMHSIICLICKSYVWRDNFCCVF